MFKIKILIVDFLKKEGERSNNVGSLVRRVISKYTFGSECEVSFFFGVVFVFFRVKCFT